MLVKEKIVDVGEPFDDAGGRLRHAGDRQRRGGGAGVAVIVGAVAVAGVARGGVYLDLIGDDRHVVLKRIGRTAAVPNRPFVDDAGEVHAHQRALQGTRDVSA